MTGIRSIEEIDAARRKIEARFNLTLHPKCRIDNIFASQKDTKNYDIGKLLATCKGLYSDKFTIIYDILLHRGIYLIPKKKKCPSLILFRTGSATVMSMRSVSDLNKTNKLLKSVFIPDNLRSRQQSC